MFFFLSDKKNCARKPIRASWSTIDMIVWHIDLVFMSRFMLMAVHTHLYILLRYDALWRILRESGGGGIWRRRREEQGAQWGRTAKNWDVSAGPLTRRFARSLTSLTRLLSPPCLLRSRALLRSLVCFLTHFLARGKVNYVCPKMTWFCPTVGW